ncbi:MAG: ATP-binding protein, partial [Candidatus Heimdallarchaeaceae archaeon]
KLLYRTFIKYKMNPEEQERLLLFVIEEAQNYAPNQSKYPIGFSVAKNVLATIATQGRKFGISLCLITQRPSFVDPIVMSMVNTFVVHRVSAEDVRFVEMVTGGLPPFITKKLTLLERGLAVLVGQMNRFGFPLLIKIPQRRVEHSVGRVKIFESSSKEG